MKLTERLNVLIQAATLSQKSGALSLDDAVKVKSAIDVISSGTLNQNYTSAINILIEISVTSQKKGVYSLKDAYMIYNAINGIEDELKNEVRKLSAGVREEPQTNQPPTNNEKNGETIVTVPPKKLKKS